MKYFIIESTDGKFLGNEIETNLERGEVIHLSSESSMEILGVLRIDNFIKVYNFNYTILLEEREE